MAKRIIKWIGNIIVFMLVILCAATLFSVIQAKSHPDQTPSIFGYKIMTILTGSMEPILAPGDMIVVKNLAPNRVKIDDVITYKNHQNTLVTHRIIDIHLREGKLFYETKGDANNIKDQELVGSNQLVGALAFHIPKAGYIADFFKSPTGITILLLIPILYLIIGKLTKTFARSGDEKLGI